MTILLSEATEARLKERAARSGQDVGQVADSLLSWALESEPVEVEAIREGIEGAEAGRERPYREFIAEHRAKYPDS